MATDLLEQLADVPIPPAPPQQQFDRAIHRRINDRLIVGQLLDLTLRGFGFAAVHFSRSLLGLLRLTFTGKFDAPKSGPQRNVE
jgi:hypothetical protein